MPSPDARAPARCGAALLAALALAAAAAPALPQTADDRKIEAARKAQSENERLAREAAARADALRRAEADAADREQQLRRERREAAQREQRHAQEVARLEAEIARLDAETAAKRADLARRAAERQRVLAALLRLAGNEPAFLVALPGQPLDNVQGALAFRAMEQTLQRRTALLAAALDDLARVRESAQAARRHADAERAALAEESLRIERMLAVSADDQRRAASLGRREAELAEKLRAEARDNEELIAALVAARRAREDAARQAKEKEEAERQARIAAEAEKHRQLAALPPPQPPPLRLERPKDLRAGPPERGGMTNPVSGRIVRNFGQSDGAGSHSKGLVFDAAGKARVLAPYDGQVVYAGPFRGYGRILIIEHGGGYHTLLSGLGRIDCAVGQWVLAGEPVAVMGEQSGAGLYVELRRDGQPVNPVPWLAAGNG